MNQQTQAEWQDLARLWQSGIAPVTVEDIEKWHTRQRLKVLAATAAELICAALGVAAAVWLGLVPRLHWVAMLTAVFSVASAVVLVRTRRVPVPKGTADLLESLKGSLAYQDWMAEQLRLGRALSFVALFAIVMAASVQLVNLASATSSGLRATVVAGAAVGAALAWNLVLTWQVRRRLAQLKSFRERLEA